MTSNLTISAFLVVEVGFLDSLQHQILTRHPITHLEIEIVKKSNTIHSPPVLCFYHLHKDMGT